MNEEPFKIDTTTPEGAPEGEEKTREPFPADVFTGVAGEMIQETRRVNGVDADIPGACALAAVSTTLGRGLQLERRGQKTPANLFLTIAAQSGVGKSETSRPIFAALHEIEAERVAENESHKIDREARKKSAEAMEKKFQKPKDKETPQERMDREARLKEELETIALIEAAMIQPRVLAGNVTTEKLALMLAANREQLGVISTDCGDVVSNILGRYTKGAEDENIYLKMYSGDPDLVDRASNERKSVNLQHPCGGLCLLGTPPVLRKLWADDQFRTGGLLPRICPVFSRSLPAFDDGTLRTIKPDMATAWGGLLRELFAKYHEALEPFFIRCSHDADEVFRAAKNDFVSRCQTGRMPEGFQSFNSRECEQAIRLAINLHAVKWGAKADRVELDAETAKAGVRLARWFLNEHRMALDDTLRAEKLALADKLTTKIKVIEAAGKDATMRELKRLHMEEGEVNRMVDTFPARFARESIPTIGGGWPSVKIKLVQA